ncbi:SusC/RagA family TonB-linked outer membrane protein [Pontibacter chinhatensis]|uniref:TonB-linked outer membrane protein, SusC/RagA family n=1 Tax=Pontibacter chinhatensis TaxID=1436961 RepID=A0A1I2R6Z5_9BACT|nr:TonB-dependent receptor [Pontibacter chinhatensis]SFG33536.1 TonB-linked outer membrane protein, SusC/RagA family [Pontibacter chinhatensis]
MRRKLYTALGCITLAASFTSAVAAGGTLGLQPLPLEATRANTLTGKVSDENGMGLPGVTVVLKGTTRGTTTDANGNFSLSVPDANGTLVFSFIGYLPQEVQINNQSTFQISLAPDTKALEEVVVVGYGTQKKSVVTGAISSVKSTDLENQQITRVEQALQGRTTGVTVASNSGAPGAAATVRVRGITTLNSNDPLYVVDGVVVNGGIDYLNQADIESIEVLKDAASAAIYGARAATGVILVTTKRGKSGAINVNYNGYLGTQAPARKLDLLNATEYATLRNEASVNGGGGIVYQDPRSLGEGTDWQEYVFNDDARIQNHEFSISGGGDKSTFFMSYGYLDQEGIVTSEISNYKRHNVRLNSNHKIASWLTVGQNLGYSHIKSQGSLNPNTEFGGPLSSAINLDPTTPVLITDPAIINDPSSVYNRQPTVWSPQGYPYGISTTVQQEMTNPLAYIQTQLGNHGWSDNIVGNVFAELEPIKGLKFRSTVGTKLAYWGGESFRPIYYLNASTQSTQTAFNRDRHKTFDYNIENILSYTRSIEKHNFTLLAGQGAYRDSHTSGISISFTNIPAKTFDEASFNLKVPTANRSSDAYEGIDHTVSSLFGRVVYDYDEKYLFTGIIRRDGSSRFGTNNKYGYFPSASIGWVASNENFWPSNDVVNFLKIRGSYGVVGNDALGDFRYISTVGPGRNYTFGNDIYLIGYSPDAPANPDLRWEETTQTNIGFETNLFQNWTLTFDWYNKKTSGILQQIDLPGYVGATGRPWGNVADMENRGVELELGYGQQIGEFNFRVSGNVSYLQNEITYLGDGKEFLEGGENIQNLSYPLTRMAVGQSYGAFYGFRTNGIFQNEEEVQSYKNSEGSVIQPDAKPGDFRWVDQNGDGQINGDDRTFIGKPLPDWTFGINFTANYKNFDLLIFGQGAAGNQIFQGLRRLDIPNANWQQSALGRWTGEGSTNEYPRLTTADDNRNFTNPSDFMLEDGDYFRIKTLQLGYTLPNSLTSKISMQKARVYVSSNNLITFTNYTGYDPEIGGSIFGIDRAFYPQARSFMVGVNIGF